ncbi:hypothetical protein RND71_044181 [Anisodus tanguticus]|uniref:Uncharacterized protein n=1 Tax=Anisodus tanguticus TaxID=243964 RepID=A0AAE1QML6_9SOLA|nr:hypothetical protein RND71_044181 [Anisodus tanguticus]
MDSRLPSQVKLEKKFGQSPVFVASTLLENGGLPNEASTSSLLKEAIHISNYSCIIFISLFISIAATGILEMQWGDVGIDDWWRNEQFWVIGGASSHFFALFQGLLKVLAGVETSFLSHPKQRPPLLKYSNTCKNVLTNSDIHMH